MKMTLQTAENLVHMQQHHSKHFYKKFFPNIALCSGYRYGHLNV